MPGSLSIYGVRKFLGLCNGNVTIVQSFNNFRLRPNFRASRPCDHPDFQMPRHAQIPASMRKHFPVGGRGAASNRLHWVWAAGLSKSQRCTTGGMLQKSAQCWQKISSRSSNGFEAETPGGPGEGVLRSAADLGVLVAPSSQAGHSYEALVESFRARRFFPEWRSERVQPQNGCPTWT